MHCKHSYGSQEKMFLLAVMFALTAGADGKCPLGFVRLGPSCYLFSPTTADFAGANSMCRFLGSRLAAIKSKKENALVKSYLIRHGKGADFYIGGTDLRGEGIFTWERPFGTKLAYKGWQPGEPNNAGNNEHCMSMGAAFQYRWNDAPCHSKYRFICERRY